jgi:hypothetical protein
VTEKVMPGSMRRSWKRVLVVARAGGCRPPTEVDRLNPHRQDRTARQLLTLHNNRRPHSALRYLRPVDYYRGDPEARLAERTQKLQHALLARQAYWKDVNAGLLLTHLRRFGIDPPLPCGRLVVDRRNRIDPPPFEAHALVGVAVGSACASEANRPARFFSRSR